ncbi:MAG: cellulase family glycosylhydrolase [Deltaproteobacteria bacterium]|nr:cellulase family glycosylhydrolase [Deltaproteobacteria bacterium]MBW2086873.1 cellulase family glycosylhydrolase [Deltaproteobacteria bacterium]
MRRRRWFPFWISIFVSFMLFVGGLMNFTNAETGGVSGKKGGKHMIKWESIKGVEISPGSGWGPEFNVVRLERDLALAKGMGFNAVKTWLVSEAYFEHRELMLKNVRTFIELCKKHGLYASFLLFHMGGGSTHPQELNREVVWIPAEKALKQCSDLIDEVARESNRPGWPLFFQNYVRRYATGTLIPFWGDPSQLYLQGSTTDPPYSKWDEEDWPKYDEYIKAILTAFGNNENVILWDVMGEPYIIANYPWLFKLLNMKFDEERVTAFLKHFCQLVAGFSPKGAITVGAGGVESVKRVEEVAGEYTTLISVHWFGPEPEQTRQVLTAVKEFGASAGKPVLLTEFGNLTLHDSVLDDSRVLGTDEGQLKYYQDIFPVVEKMEIGWFLYCLITGEGPFANSGLLYPSGLNRPAANYLRDRLKK